MSLEAAILRRARLKQSFCSYTFQELSKPKGCTVIKLSKKKQQTQKTSSTLSVDTAAESQSNVKSCAEINKHKGSQVKKVIKNDKLVSIQASFQVEETISKDKKEEKKNNRMQQYLFEFNELRQEPSYKSNTFEHVPLQRQVIVEQNIRESYHLKENQGNLAIKKKPKYDSIVKRCFDCRKLGFLFEDFSLEENEADKPYTKIRIISIHKNLYFQLPIGENVFSELPIKYYCSEFNGHCTSLESNIFYIALSKEPGEEGRSPYTQCFFWLNRPFKHNERLMVRKIIIDFYVRCLKKMKISKTAGKIWVVDYHGRISFMNPKAVDEEVQLRGWENQKSSSIHSKISPFASICLNMFISTMSRGQFTAQSNHRVTPHSLLSQFQ